MAACHNFFTESTEWINSFFSRSLNSISTIFSTPLLPITTGTPAGVGMGMNPPEYLKNGDEMILKVDNLGEQRLKVVKEI